MTDRELLELAAKAAGYGLPSDDDHDEIGRQYEYHIGLWVKHPWGWGWFRPHIDDGDALRLLASMREKFGSMLLAIFEDRVECGDVNYCQSIEDIVDGDIPRAIRSAIVRAAAQIQLNKEAANE